MLRSFESIENCGIFQDFRWGDTPEFQRINLIYGPNGTGKTSLSRAFSKLMGDANGISVSVSDSAGARSRPGVGERVPQLDGIFVFSEDYVARSHSFDADAQLDAVLTLGERSVEEEVEIVTLKAAIEADGARLVTVKAELPQATRALEDEFRSISNSVYTSLSQAKGDYRSRSSYSLAEVRKRFGESHASWKMLDDDQLASDLAVVNSGEQAPVSQASLSREVPQWLVEKVREALAIAPVSVALDSLVEHPAASTWVDAGRELHDGLSACIFCGGNLSQSRRVEIDGHFSRAVEMAMALIDESIDSVEQLRTGLKLLTAEATQPQLFDDLRERYVVAHDSAVRQVTALLGWLDEISAVLLRKRENVLASLEYADVSPPKVDGSEVEALLEEHNRRVTSYSTLVQRAARRVELHLLKVAEPNVLELEERVRSKTAEAAEIEERLRGARERIAALENVDGDPLPSARVLARELARILGRDELSFTLLPDGKRYQVTRHGQAARDLSTGERTAITLIHFLELVRQAAVDDHAIVVIDDPVSSLDGNTATGISTYIWSETVAKPGVAQVFLLTHNFDLFRQWDIQIEGLPGNAGPGNTKGFSSQVFELTAKHRNAGDSWRREPRLSSWPPSPPVRKKVRSAYHHAFITATSALVSLKEGPSMESELDALLLYPNVLRRLLETFTAFKSPASVGSFNDSMRAVGAMLDDLGYEGESDALRLQLTRFTHAHSHAESPETNATVNPGEIATVIASVFTFMRVVDQDHFDGLCKVIGVDPGVLLLEAPDVEDASRSEAPVVA